LKVTKDGKESINSRKDIVIHKEKILEKEPEADQNLKSRGGEKTSFKYKSL
jgi:hypothetical protein